jgi:16S rRNA G1207 methylase RsmC
MLGAERWPGRSSRANAGQLHRCVEISALHCQILKAKGYAAIETDFLKFSTTSLFDRIVMNPPFSEGRWQAHIEHASAMLANGGRLVAILPASAKGKDVLPGLKHEWSQVYSNEFAGTSVSVVILSASAA